MPAAWKNLAKRVAESYEKSGVNPEEALRRGFATATKTWKKTHGGRTPQSADKKKKKE